MEKMNFKKTERGFALIEFKDRYDKECSIQKSSLAFEDAIWLGCSEAEPRLFHAQLGWRPVDVPGMLTNTRMHLTVDQVRELIPILQYFVENGELPIGDYKENK